MTQENKERDYISEVKRDNEENIKELLKDSFLKFLKETSKVPYDQSSK